MKNFLYFIVGMIYLPILMVIKVVIYIRDLGMGFIDDYKFWKRVNNNLKTRKLIRVDELEENELLEE